MVAHEPAGDHRRVCGGRPTRLERGERRPGRRGRPRRRTRRSTRAAAARLPSGHDTAQPDASSSRVGPRTVPGEKTSATHVRNSVTSFVTRARRTRRPARPFHAAFWDGFRCISRRNRPRSRKGWRGGGSADSSWYWGFSRARRPCAGRPRPRPGCVCPPRGRRWCAARGTRPGWPRSCRRGWPQRGDARPRLHAQRLDATLEHHVLAEAGRFDAAARLGRGGLAAEGGELRLEGVVAVVELDHRRDRRWCCRHAARMPRRRGQRTSRPVGGRRARGRRRP